MVKIKCPCCCRCEFAVDLVDAVAPFLPFLMAMNAAKHLITTVEPAYEHLFISVAILPAVSTLEEMQAVWSSFYWNCIWVWWVNLVPAGVLCN